MNSYAETAADEGQIRFRLFWHLLKIATLAPLLFAAIINLLAHGLNAPWVDQADYFLRLMLIVPATITLDSMIFGRLIDVRSDLELLARRHPGWGVPYFAHQGIETALVQDEIPTDLSNRHVTMLASAFGRSRTRYYRKYWLKLAARYPEEFRASVERHYGISLRVCGRVDPEELDALAEYRLALGSGSPNHAGDQGA